MTLMFMFYSQREAFCGRGWEGAKSNASTPMRGTHERRYINPPALTNIVTYLTTYIIQQYIWSGHPPVIWDDQDKGPLG